MRKEKYLIIKIFEVHMNESLSMKKQYFRSTVECKISKYFLNLLQKIIFWRLFSRFISHVKFQIVVLLLPLLQSLIFRNYEKVFKISCRKIVFWRDSFFLTSEIYKIPTAILLLLLRHSLFQFILEFIKKNLN